jgi:hypothetical protein
MVNAALRPEPAAAWPRNSHRTRRIVADLMFTDPDVDRAAVDATGLGKTFMPPVVMVAS